MATPVQMPKQGNTVEECLIVEWNADVGSSVAEGDVLCTIETDKASFEVEAPAAGTLLKTFFDAGELVPVLINIAVIGEEGEDPAPFAPEQAADTQATPKGAPKETPAQSPAASAAPAPGPASPQGQKVRISPLARKLAVEMNVDPNRVTGSGPSGRILSDDIRAAAASGTSAPSPVVAPVAGSTIGVEQPPVEVPYVGIRKLIGDRMMQSLTEHAQLTLNGSADASGLLAYRKTVKDGAEAMGLPNITLNDMIGFVVARTLLRFPELNALFTKSAGVLQQYHQVHLAFAVDTPRGLMVPVIRNAHALSLAGLSTESLRLAESCRAGSIDPDLLQGGTFTITNLGSLGVEHFTPVLNSPQVAILGIGAIDQKAVPAPDGNVRWQPTMALSLTIDHQVVDGAPAAKFLKAVSDGLANLPLVLAG